MDSSIGGWPGVAVLVTVFVTSLSFEVRHQLGLQAGSVVNLAMLQGLTQP